MIIVDIKATGEKTPFHKNPVGLDKS